MLESILNKVARLKRSGTLLKRDSMQVFPCEICEIFKNTFFYRIQKFFNSPIEDIPNSFFANQ